MSEFDNTFPFISELSRHIGKPVVIIDTETTGFLNDPNVKMVEFAYMSILSSGEVRIGERLINPERAIPKEASKVHGIYDKHVSSSPVFPHVMPLIARICTEAVFCGYNSKSFDYPLIKKCCELYGLEAPAAKNHLDVRYLWTKKKKTQYGKLVEVAGFFGVEIGEEHRAGGDVLTTANILEKMTFLWGADFVCSHIASESVPKSSSPSSTKPAAQKAKNANGKSLGTSNVLAAQKEVASKYILEHLRVYDNFLPQDIPVAAKENNISESSVSFAVKDLADKGAIEVSQIVDDKMQELIELYIDEAISEVGDEKLKPLKEFLDKKCEVRIEYNQIRIALERCECEC